MFGALELRKARFGSALDALGSGEVVELLGRWVGRFDPALVELVGLLPVRRVKAACDVEVEGWRHAG